MTHILIPRTPSMNLLRPFIECPTSELDQAWAAMVRIAEVQHARAGSQCLAQIAEPAAPAAVAPQGERQWICPTRTVADLVNNLLTMDQGLPVYGAQYIEKDGRRCAIAVPPTVSRERVLDGRWIGQGEDLNAAVVWTRAEQPAAMEGSAARKVFLVATGETSDGAETYTRHDDAPPPLCDAECLYTAPAAPALEAPAAPAGWREVIASARDGLSDATPSGYDNAGYLDFACTVLDSVEDELAALAAAPQAPAAPAVDAELLELAQAIVKFNREHGSVLAVHIDNLADLVDERAAQAKEGGA